MWRRHAESNHSKPSGQLSYARGGRPPGETDPSGLWQSPGSLWFLLPEQPVDARRCTLNINAEQICIFCLRPFCMKDQGFLLHNEVTSSEKVMKHICFEDMLLHAGAQGPWVAGRSCTNRQDYSQNMTEMSLLLLDSQSRSLTVLFLFRNSSALDFKTTSHVWLAPDQNLLFSLCFYMNALWFTLVPMWKSSTALVPMNASSICVCVSIPPGITSLSVASITRAPDGTRRSGPTSTILPPLMKTSLRKEQSSFTTFPPLIRIPLASAIVVSKRSRPGNLCAIRVQLQSSYWGGGGELVPPFGLCYNWKLDKIRLPARKNRFTQINI